MILRSLTIAAALSFAAAPALAQDADLEALLRDGLQQRRERRDVEALATFQRAAGLSRTPRVVAQVGFAEQALGRWIDAEGHLLEALGAASDPWVADRRRVLEDALREVGQHLGNLEVQVNVAGAAVIVNGRRVGDSPLVRPIRVVAGTSLLEVSAPGHLPDRRTVAVGTGGMRREVIELASAATEMVATPPVVTPLPTNDNSGTRRTLAWVAGGGALAGLGVGFVGMAVRESEAARWNDPACLAGQRTRGENCGAHYDAGRTAEAVEIAGFVVGGALAVTSAVLFLTLPPRRRAVTGVAWTWCGPGPTGLGVTCGGTL